MKKIKTFEGACKALDIKTTLPDVSAMPEKHQKALIAHYKLVIIAEALNDGWKPNWDDWNEYKYYPWFSVDKNKKGSGFGLSNASYDCTGTDSDVGSRLCFKSREIAEYIGKTFIKLYEEYFLFFE